MIDEKKLKKLLRYQDDPQLAVFELLSELQDGLPKYSKLLELLNGIEKIKGERGEKGDKGDTPAIGKDYYTQEEHDSFINEIVKKLKGVIKGEKGDTGRGLPGKTPIKGIDYLADDELDGIKNDILKKSTPIKGKHYFDGENGKDGKNADERKIIKFLQTYIDNNSLKIGDVIKELKNKKSKNRLGIEDIWNMPAQGKQDQRWHGGGNIVLYTDLSDQLNGVTKTFRISNSTDSATGNSKVITLNYSSFPFIFRPNIDYTFSNGIITFTSSVDAPATGQTLIVTWKK